jgi:hypothetical protein
MEGVKLVKIIVWKPVGNGTGGRSKNRWIDEVIRDLKKRKLRNLMQFVEDGKACGDLVHKTKTHVWL